MKIYTSTYSEAKDAVLKYALEHGVDLVLYGVGDELDEPHAVAQPLDWVSGGVRGYFVTVFPTEWTLNRVKHHFTVTIQ